MKILFQKIYLNLFKSSSHSVQVYFNYHYEPLKNMLITSETLIKYYFCFTSVVPIVAGHCAKKIVLAFTQNMGTACGNVNHLRNTISLHS